MRTSLWVLAAASAALAGCQVHTHDGRASGPRNYQVGNFHEIEVAGPYDVEVHTGGNPGVSAQGSQELIDHTVVEVQGDKLVIHPENSHRFFHFGWENHGKAKFTVTLPQLSGLTLAGSGDIHIDRIQGQKFEGTIAGHGDLVIGTVDVQQLKMTIAGSGDAKAAGGKAQTAEYEIAGHGNLDAGAIQTQQVKVSIAGSGDVKAHSTGTAEVEIVGAGDVDISGGAKCSISKTGAGDVRCS